MKTLYLLSALSALFLTACNWSYRTMYFTEFQPEEMNVDSVNVQEYEKKYGKYDGVILHNEFSFDQAGITLSTSYSLGRIRYIVLNPNAQWLTTLNLNIGRGRLTEAYVSIVYPDGKRKQFSIDDFKLMTETNGDRVYKFAYPEIVKGTIIEESYEIERGLSFIINHSVPLQFSIPCESNSYQCGYHSMWEMKLKTDSTKLRGLSVENDEDNNKQIIKYRGFNIAAYVDEPYSSLLQERILKIEFMYSKLARYKARVITSDSWADASTRYADWVIREEPDEYLAEEALGQINSSLSDVEKLAAITAYVQKNYELVYYGEDDIDEVFQNKQGTDEQLCALTREMLTAVNLKADMVMVHSAYDGNFIESYVNLYEVRYPAVVVQIEDVQYLVFPYLKNYPIDVIPQHLQEQRALKIVEDEENAHFITTPPGIMSNNTVSEQYKLNINAEGEIEVQEEKTLSGAAAYTIREMLAEMKADEIEKSLKELLTYSEGDVKIISHEVVNQSDYQKPLIIKLAYKIDNLITVMPDEVIFQTGGLFSPSSNVKLKIDADERVNPIRVYADEKYIKDISIKFPANWELTSVLKNLEQENKFGKIKGTYTTAPGEIQVNQERLLLKSTRPKEEIGDLLQIIGRKSQLYIPTMIFKVK